MECRLHIVRRNKAPMDFELSSIDINICGGGEGRRGLVTQREGQRERGEGVRERVRTPLTVCAKRMYIHVRVCSYNYICICIHGRLTTRARVYNAYRAGYIICARAPLNEKPKYIGRRVGITPIGGYLSDKQPCTRGRALALARRGTAGVQVGYTRCVTRGEW